MGRRWGRRRELEMCSHVGHAMGDIPEGPRLGGTSTTGVGETH